MLSTSSGPYAMPARNYVLPIGYVQVVMAPEMSAIFGVVYGATIHYAAGESQVIYQVAPRPWNNAHPGYKSDRTSYSGRCIIRLLRA